MAMPRAAIALATESTRNGMSSLTTARRIRRWPASPPLEVSWIATSPGLRRAAVAATNAAASSCSVADEAVEFARQGVGIERVAQQADDAFVRARIGSHGFNRVAKGHRARAIDPASGLRQGGCALVFRRRGPADGAIEHLVVGHDRHRMMHAVGAAAGQDEREFAIGRKVGQRDRRGGAERFAGLVGAVIDLVGRTAGVAFFRYQALEAADLGFDEASGSRRTQSARRSP